MFNSVMIEIECINETEKKNQNLVGFDPAISGFREQRILE